MTGVGEEGVSCFLFCFGAAKSIRGFEKLTQAEIFFSVVLQSKKTSQIENMHHHTKYRVAKTKHP